MKERQKEIGKFYVSAGGQIMIFKDKIALSKTDADFVYANLLHDGADTIKSQTTEEKKKQAMDFLCQVKILPYRIH